MRSLRLFLDAEILRTVERTNVSWGVVKMNCEEEINAHN